MRRSSLSRSALLVAAALASIGCADKPKVGDETHFDSCVIDEDCRTVGPSFVCELGVCRSSSSIVAVPAAPASDAGTSLPATRPPPRVAPFDAGRRATSPGSGSGAMRGQDGFGIVLHPDAGTPKDVPGVPPHDAGTPKQDAGTPKQDAGAAKNTPPPGGVLAETDGEIQAVAMDDRTIYFSSDNGLLRRVAKDGSGGVQVVTSTPSFVEGVAADDSFVYFTDLVGGTINRISKTGGASSVIATGQTRPWGIAVDGTTIYWANQGTNMAGSPNDGAAIMAVSKKAGSPVTLAAGQQMSTAITLDGAGGVVWLNGPFNSNGSIRYLASGQSTPTELGSLPGFSSAPVVTQRRAVWLNGSSLNSLSSAPLGGGAVSTLLRFAAVDGWTPPVAADATSVYFACSATGVNDGSIGKVALTGGAPQQLTGPVSLLPGLMVGNKVVALLVDANNVYTFDYYATTGEHGRIRSVAK